MLSIFMFLLSYKHEFKYNFNIFSKITNYCIQTDCESKLNLQNDFSISYGFENIENRIYYLFIFFNKTSE